jgi:hypothetical protein
MSGFGAEPEAVHSGSQPGAYRTVSVSTADYQVKADESAECADTEETAKGTMN